MCVVRRSEKTGDLIVCLRESVLMQKRGRTHTFALAERPLAGTGLACLDSFSVIRKHNIRNMYIVCMYVPIYSKVFHAVTSQ